jgi:hypothetical protein
MKKELETALEGLNDEETKVFLEDVKAYKEGKEEGKAHYDEVVEQKKREDNLKDIKETGKACEFMKNAKMPIKFKDNDLGFGEGEYDVREISAKTKRQLDYRFACMQVNLLRDTAQSLRDTQRLLMLVLRKMGVTDIQAELADLYEELEKECGHNA